MTEELVEATARALFEAAYPGSRWDTAAKVSKDPFPGLARAVIPVVLEEAAKVADQAHQEAQEHGTPVWANEIAQSIRNLGSI